MKRNKLQNQLKREAEMHTPDVFDRVMLSARQEGLLDNGSAAPQREKSPRRNGQRVWIAAAALSAAACCAIVLPVALFTGGSGGSGGGGTTIPLSARNAYGMGAVTTIKLLGSEIAGSAIRSLSLVKQLAETEGEIAESQIAKFHEYFTLFTAYLGEEEAVTSEEANTDAAYAQFSRKLTVSGVGLNGNRENYVMYYNETLQNVKEEKDETEEKYFLEGVMAFEGVEYALRGEREFETEKDEIENELKICAYPDLNDKTTYVKMEIEESSEEGETEREYVYSVVKGGKLIEETSVEFESEQKGDKEKNKFELEFRSGEAKGKYKMKHEAQDGVLKMKTEYEIDGKSGEFFIVPTQSGYQYVFEDGHTFYFD